MAAFLFAPFSDIDEFFGVYGFCRVFMGRYGFNGSCICEGSLGGFVLRLISLYSRPNVSSRFQWDSWAISGFRCANRFDRDGWALSGFRCGFFLGSILDW